jgi:tRNA threonylcarbamoyladenosine biosynthesis protein TsaE
MISGKIITKSFEETQELGRKIAKNLKNTNILALHGDLGAGKTTLVQGLAQGLGISQKIISPTFIIVRKYTIEANKSQKLKAKNFYHIDLYRIADENDIKGLGLEEILHDESNVVAIEWPEKAKNILPGKSLHAYLEYLNADERSIEIK